MEEQNKDMKHGPAEDADTFWDDSQVSNTETFHEQLDAHSDLDPEDQAAISEEMTEMESVSDSAMEQPQMSDAQREAAFREAIGEVPIPSEQEDAAVQAQREEESDQPPQGLS